MEKKGLMSILMGGRTSKRKKKGIHHIFPWGGETSPSFWGERYLWGHGKRVP